MSCVLSRRLPKLPEQVVWIAPRIRMAFPCPCNPLTDMAACLVGRAALYLFLQLCFFKGAKLSSLMADNMGTYHWSMLPCMMADSILGHIGRAMNQSSKFLCLMGYRRQLAVLPVFLVNMLQRQA